MSHETFEIGEVELHWKGSPPRLLADSVTRGFTERLLLSVFGGRLWHEVRAEGLATVVHDGHYLLLSAQAHVYYFASIMIQSCKEDTDLHFSAIGSLMTIQYDDPSIMGHCKKVWACASSNQSRCVSRYAKWLSAKVTNCAYPDHELAAKTNAFSEWLEQFPGR